MFNKLNILLGIGLAALGTGCGKGESSATTSQQFSFDGVKLIAPSIVKNNDPASTGQGSYMISNDHHLLIRFETLSKHVSSIVVSEKNRVEAQVTVTADMNAAAARSSLKMCPITKQWMMLATWSYGHPFGDDGKWGQDGGDFDGDGCVLSNKGDATVKTLIFDVSRWYTDYVKGRSVNYGLLLVSSDPFSVLGEGSGSYSPRITFNE